MTAGVLLDRLSRAGVSVTLDGADLVLRPRRLVDGATIDKVRAHKAEVIRELRQRDQQPVGISPTPADAIVEAARLLREGRWPVTSPVCGFSIGHPGERCERCGASWHEHLQSKTGK